MNQTYEKIDGSKRYPISIKDMKSGDIVEDVETKVKYRVMNDPFMVDKENWGIHAERMYD